MTKNNSVSRSKSKSLYLAIAGVVAALYVVLTLPFAQFAFGPIQFRLAELLVVLPILFPAAIPGVTIGCFLSNLLNPGSLGPIDVIFGTLATFLAAVSTRLIATKLETTRAVLKDILSLIPPVVWNALIVGTYLTFLLADTQVTGAMIVINILYIGASELVVEFFLGLPFLLFLRRLRVDRWQK